MLVSYKVALQLASSVIAFIAKAKVDLLLVRCNFLQAEERWQTPRTWQSLQIYFDCLVASFSGLSVAASNDSKQPILGLCFPLVFFPSLALFRAVFFNSSRRTATNTTYELSNPKLYSSLQKVNRLSSLLAKVERLSFSSPALVTHTYTDNNSRPNNNNKSRSRQTPSLRPTQSQTNQNQVDPFESFVRAVCAALSNTKCRMRELSATFLPSSSVDGGMFSAVASNCSLQSVRLKMIGAECSVSAIHYVMYVGGQCIE